MSVNFFVQFFFGQKLVVKRWYAAIEKLHKWCTATKRLGTLVLGQEFSLFALALRVGSHLPQLWSPLFPPHASAPILFSRQGTASAHLDSLPPNDLVIWTEDSVTFAFGKSGSGVLANCSLCGTEATLFVSAGPVCSTIFTEACATLQAIR